MARQARHALPVMQLVAIIACLAALLWEGGRRDHQLSEIATATKELAGVVANGAIEDARREQVLSDIQRRLARLER